MFLSSNPPTYNKTFLRFFCFVCFSSSSERILWKVKSWELAMKEKAVLWGFRPPEDVWLWESEAWAHRFLAHQGWDDIAPPQPGSLSQLKTCKITPQTKWLKTTYIYFSQFWGLRNPKSKWRYSGPGSLFLTLHRRWPSLLTHMAETEAKGKLSGTSSYKGTSTSGGPSLHPLTSPLSFVLKSILSDMRYCYSSFLINSVCLEYFCSYTLTFSL